MPRTSLLEWAQRYTIKLARVFNNTSSNRVEMEVLLRGILVPAIWDIRPLGKQITLREAPDGEFLDRLATTILGWHLPEDIVAGLGI